MTATLGADVIRAADGSGPVEFPDGIITGTLNGGDVSSGLDTIAARDAAIAAHSTFTIIVAVSGGNYTTLSAALAAVPAGGCRIQIKSGTYAGGVTVSTAYTRIVGEGRDLVTIQGPLSTATAITVDANNVSIESLTIDGQRASGATGVGIDATSNKTNISIINVRVKNTGAQGIYLATGNDDALIQNCIVENLATNGTTAVAGAFAAGVYFQGVAARPRILNNYITGWSQAIGLWYGVHDAYVAGNRCVANYGYADAGHTTPRSCAEDYGETVVGHGNNIWIGNLFDGATMNLIECANGVIGSRFIGNTCKNGNRFGDNTSAGGIELSGGVGQLTYDIAFVGNYLYGDGTRTIRMDINGYSESAILIEANHFIGCTVTGSTGPIQIGSGTGITIKCNFISGCWGGVYISATSGDNIQIDGNQIVSLTAGVSVALLGGNHHAVCRNRIYGATRAISSTVGLRHEIVGNSIYMPSGSAEGIYLTTTYCRVELNDIYSLSTGAAISAASGAAHNQIVNNTIDAASAYGIRVLSGATYNVVQNNDSTAAISIRGDEGGATNIYEPNIENGVNKVTSIRPLGAKTVNSTQTTIAHGLGYIPTIIEVLMNSGGTVWRSAASDATNVYLTADTDGRTAEIFVR